MSGRNRSEEQDQVAIEEPLEIRVAGEPLAITMRTPGEDEALTVGFLFTEGIIRGADDLTSVSHCGKPGEEGYGNVVDAIPAPGVSLRLEKLEVSKRGTLRTSACGVCGRRSISDLLQLCGALSAENVQIDFDMLASSTARLSQAQHNFSRTGGTHAAMVLGDQGEALAAYEDVGRHNAVDKVIGKLVADGILGRALGDDAGHQALSRKAPRPKPTLLAVSGRASFEIIQKATVARIPIVASVSAASSLAIDLAEHARITLAAFVRPGKLNIYTGAQRVLFHSNAPAAS